MSFSACTNLILRLKQCMAAIVDYSLVLSRMLSQGMQSLYHNSGAFGFSPEMKTHSCGWIGPADPTVRPEAARLIRSVPPPHEVNLTNLLLKLWRDRFGGPLWVMPRSHWSYELQFGSRGWMPDLLRQVGVDPTSLIERNNAAALEFDGAESVPAALLLERLLEKLRGSDFALVFPDHPVLCTLHHHKQLWWVTTDVELAAQIEAMPQSLK
jgi:hypothetical protein